MNEQNQIHKTFKKLRKTCKLSQARIGKVLEIDQAGISRIEKAQQQISLEGLFKLSQFYQIDIEHLITGKINYYRLAKQFGINTNLPKAYFEDQIIPMREIIPFIRYIQKVNGSDVVEKMFHDINLKDFPYINLDEKVGVKCFYDILNYALEANLFTQSEIGNIAGEMINPMVLGHLYESFQGMKTQNNLLLNWFLNAHLVEGLFYYEILGNNKNEMSIIIQLNERAQDLDFNKFKIGQLILGLRKEFLEKLNAHFGFTPIKIEITTSPFTHFKKRGELMIIKEITQ